MQGLQFSVNAAVSMLLGLACLMCFSINEGNAAYSMSQTCLYTPSNTYIGDPDNCQGWGYCQNNQLVATGNCSAGYLYNISKGICDYADNVQCQNSFNSTCAKFTSPQYVADPSNCTNYWYCSSTTQMQFSCPIGQYFNSLTVSCVWSSALNCSADSPCALVQDNTFVQNPDQCGEFISCYNGQMPYGPQNCSTEGYSYNGLTGLCGPTNNCNGQNTPSSPNGPFPPNPTACEGQVTTAGDTYVSDEMTCSGFFICSSNAANNGVWGKCPLGTHFNATAFNDQPRCVSPFDYVCPYNRCNNLDLSYVADAGCETFTYCKNQQPVVAGLNCSYVGTDVPYFNEYYGTCIATKPQVAICNPPAAAAA